MTTLYRANDAADRLLAAAGIPLAVILAAPSHAAPLPCCFNPAAHLDTRCGPPHLFYGPGFNVDDQGTWSRYSPWAGDCLGVGGKEGQHS